MLLNVVSLVLTIALQAELAVRVPLVVYRTFRRSRVRSSEDNGHATDVSCPNEILDEFRIVSSTPDGALGAVRCHALSNQLAMITVPVRAFHVSPLRFPSVATLMSQMELESIIARLLGVLSHVIVHLPLTALPGDENSAVIVTAIWAVQAARELAAVANIFSVKMLEIRYLAEIISARLDLIQQSANAAATSTVADVLPSLLGTVAGSSPRLLLTYHFESKSAVSEDLSAATPKPVSSSAAAATTTTSPAQLPTLGVSSENTFCGTTVAQKSSSPVLIQASGVKHKKVTGACPVIFSSKKPTKPNRHIPSRRNAAKETSAPHILNEIVQFADVHACGISHNISIYDTRHNWSSLAANQAFRRLAAAGIRLEWRIAEMMVTVARMGFMKSYVTSNLTSDFIARVRWEIYEALVALDLVSSFLVLPAGLTKASQEDLERLEWLAANARGSIFNLYSMLPADFYGYVAQEVPAMQVKGNVGKTRLHTSASLDTTDFRIKAKKIGG